MSGTAGVSTQFQAAVTATGLQLDNNFGQLVAYANDPTNRANYATDGGTTNTLVINPSPPVIGGYTAGLTITFRAAFSSSGAVVANVNGLGNASVLDQQQRQLTVSALIAGSVYQMAYNGTSAFNLLSPNAIVANQPALTTLTSGAGTYTVSAGAVRIRVRGVGPGGGGANGIGGGSAGGNTQFGILLAGGGRGGTAAAAGGVGGTATGATINLIGGAGTHGNGGVGGAGGDSSLGGGGSGGTTSSVGVTSGAPNTGGGGGGSNNGDAGAAGGGGGSGSTFEHNFLTPASSYTYSVGVGGTAAGGAATGAAGIIMIETFFA